MRYLRIDNGVFGFVTDEVHEILEADVPITDDEYNEFFKNQSAGKQYKLKAVLDVGLGIFGYVEEFKPEPVQIPKTEIELLQEELLNNKLAMAELIEQTQQDKLDSQLVTAELIETIMGGGAAV